MQNEELRNTQEKLVQSRDKYNELKVFVSNRPGPLDFRVIVFACLLPLLLRKTMEISVSGVS